MGLPKTRIGLETIGYKYMGDGSCSACGVPLLWFETTRIDSRTGKLHKMCFHIEAGSENEEHRVLIPHWASCPNAADFRRKKGNKKT